MGAYAKGGIIQGGFKIFLVVGHIPVEVFLLKLFLPCYTNKQ